MEERTIMPLIKGRDRGGGGGGGGGGCGLHTCIPMHVVCILMGFRPKNEPNDPYGHPNDLEILLIPIYSNP